MASILPFSKERRRRVRPARRGELRGEIVIFSGVRIERSVVERIEPPIPQKAAQPKPGRGL